MVRVRLGDLHHLAYQRIIPEQLAAGREGEDGKAGLRMRAREGLDGCERDQNITEPTKQLHEEDLTYLDAPASLLPIRVEYAGELTCGVHGGELLIPRSHVGFAVGHLLPPPLRRRSGSIIPTFQVCKPE